MLKHTEDLQKAAVEAKASVAEQHDAIVQAITDLHTSPQVARLMEGSKWAAGPTGVGGWRPSLQDAPEGVCVQGVDNRVQINRMTPRCSLIDLGLLDHVTGRKKKPVFEPRHDDEVRL